MVKILMTTEFIDRVATSMMSRAFLKDLVATTVKKHSDKHYLVVTLHKGISARVQNRSFAVIAKLLSCSTRTVHHYIAEHAVESLSKAGCSYCRHASRRLKARIKTESAKGRTVDISTYPGYLMLY